MQASLRSLRMLGCDATPSRRMRRPPSGLMLRPERPLRETQLFCWVVDRCHTLGLLPSPLWGGVGGGGSAYGNVAASPACSHLHITKPTRCHRPRRRTIQ